ncbi:hypothetical protein Herbaro_19310 [Herbaspirillum sp. WKF16]|uniref:hypothetical protein n=1 Tax=Herbaspirillum sp. WKF16 TaxID=3028312 RepID=UPI0023A947C8|nr:hypothetical protein [Herbaspirillum sp. WKF16]WDZ95604.1 hypothetical protein Herbaro_19310 [Herbaspirillum sp. WKF16]
MRKAIRGSLQMLVCAVAAAGTAGCSWAPWGEKEDPTVVPFKTIMSGSYQGFLKNWDDKKQPVFCTLIRSRAEWDEWMQPAPVAGDKRPYGPATAHFDTKQYLLVARTMRAPDAAERPHVFTPLSVTWRQETLRINYLYRAPSSGASYTIKDYLMLAIPKERYTTGPVVFYENDRKVCQLDR